MITITTIERFNPIWCKILITLRSINIEKTITGIRTGNGGPSLKAPIIPSKNNGEPIAKTTPNWIKKLPATHFIRFLFCALVIANPSLSNKISPTASATINSTGPSISIGIGGIWRKVNSNLHQSQLRTIIID